MYCLMFEASPALAAKLAYVFPAPPGCERLKLAASCDRSLSGKAAGSAKAISQRPDPSDVVLDTVAVAASDEDDCSEHDV